MYRQIITDMWIFVKYASKYAIQFTLAHTKEAVIWWLKYWYLSKVYIMWTNGLLTHWGRVTRICVGKLTIIGSDNGLSPERRQAIIWTNAGILLIGPLGTNFSEIVIEIQTFSLKKIRLKMSSAKCCSFRLGLNVLTHCGWLTHPWNNAGLLPTWHSLWWNRKCHMQNGCHFVSASMC